MLNASCLRRIAGDEMRDLLSGAAHLKTIFSLTNIENRKPSPGMVSDRKRGTQKT
jgi:hypothetical protein